MSESILRAVAGTEDEGLRLDRFIADKFGGGKEPGCGAVISRNYAEQLISQGNVAVNGSVADKKKRKMSQGDEVFVTVPEPACVDIVPEDIPLDIVYEDDDVIVINKPRGMVVHPGPGNYSGTMVNAIMYHCGDSLSSINGEVRPGIVHRIDKDTSGLIMAAKNNLAHESLAAQLERHSVTREYWAVCCDNIKEDELTIDAPIGRDPKDRLRRAVYGLGAKEAVTHIRVLERYGRTTLVAARLETGRTHQIRVHMAHIKHPLLGDQLYGPRRQALKLPESTTGDSDSRTGGQILHAKILGFEHPRTGKYLEFDSSIPDYFESVLERCRK